MQNKKKVQALMGVFGSLIVNLNDYIASKGTPN